MSTKIVDKFLKSEKVANLVRRRYIDHGAPKGEGDLSIFRNLDSH